MGWTTGYPKPDKNRPLYCLSEITAAVDTLLVTIHGGEKAADAAATLGLLATCNAGGEQAVKKTDWTLITKYSTAAITIDHDQTGEKFGLAIANILKKQNPNQVVKIIRLPDLPPKGDIVEWMATGGTKERYLEIVSESPEVTAEQVANLVAIKKPTSELDAATEAESFLSALEVDGLPCLRFWQDVFYYWTGTHYRELLASDVRGRIVEFLNQSYCKLSTKHVANVLE